MYKKVFQKSLIYIFIICVYVLASHFDLLNTIIIPKSNDLITCFIDMIKSGELLEHIIISLERIFIGFFISIALSVFFIIIKYFAPKISDIYDNLLILLRYIPPLSLIGVLILSLGINEASKIAIIILASFYPIYLSFRKALFYNDKELIEVGICFGYTKREIFTKIIIKSSMPDIINGLNIGFGYAFRAIVAAEMIAASSGLGYLINDAFMMFRQDRLFVGIISIFLLSVVFENIFNLLGKKYARA